MIMETERLYLHEMLQDEEVYSIIRDTNPVSQHVALRNGMIKRG